VTGRAILIITFLAAVMVARTVPAQAPSPDDGATGRPDATEGAPPEPDPGQDGQAGADTPQDETAGSDAPEDDSLTPRGHYNLALARFHGNDLAGAARGFLKARDEAGTDARLRYRAAFNLGVTLAAQADTGLQEKPEEAIETLRQSAAWFQDAVRLAPAEEDDARVNLEIVLRRIQQLADQLNQGNRLEARLDRVIDDQRGLRDGVRKLLQIVEAEGVSAEPLGFAREFDDLATLQRTLLADVGSILDLAGEERAGIEGKAEEERGEEERIRQAQLENLDHYLQRARQSMSDARRRLRRLEGERAHRRADAALAELKRGREQLLDPVTVLKGIAQDQTELMIHTQGLAALRGGQIRLAEDQTATPPAWLTDEHLEERQQDAALRTGEVHARLDAGVSHADSPAPGEDAVTAPPGPPDDPAGQRIIEAAREAIPFLEEAGNAMRDAAVSIPAGDLVATVESEATAIQALLGAIERFAGVRDLIELAYADQSRVVTLLTPPEEAGEPDSTLADLSTEERTRLVGEAATQNRERLARLEELLEDERQQAEAQATQGAEGAAPPQDTAPQMEAIQQRYDLAQELRQKADDAVAEMEEGLDALAVGGTAGDLRKPAGEALQHLEELRRLFFSIVEHLEELLRNQAETHDQTATLQFEGEEDQERRAALGMADHRQFSHTATGDALAEALAGQADAAAASGDPAAQQATEKLAEAAGEVQSAAGRMRDAGGILSEAVEFADTQSTDLEPALEAQIEAMEHLENAIRLLQPPSGEQQQQQDQQQQPQPQPQKDEQMSQRQAQRRLQAIRDREAERQRRNRQQAKPEPVEKDW
jgi:hypothetical protein